MNPDFLINQEAKLIPIPLVVYDLGIGKTWEAYGNHIAKIDASQFDDRRRKAKLVLVTAINPTPAGEGKTTTTIGLSDALCKLGQKSIVCLREPALGPVFGMKGGATGGGYSQVAPMDKINLHFTGDFAAIASAHNLLAAMIDNHIYQGNALGIDRVTWRRAIDMNDRALRDRFDIVVASEVMAVLCLVSCLEELKDRLGDIVVGYNGDLEITARDLKADGAMTALLMDAIKPNLVQTLENNPAIIHGGPFANIAHGCNSVIATDLAMKLGDYVVTEAGFGSDLGFEKYMDIKAAKSMLYPDVAVVVATVRALKHHGNGDLKLGFNNLVRHINNVKSYNVPCVVCINKFSDDTQEDLDFIQHNSKGIADDCVVSEHWAKGSTGALDLATSVMNTINVHGSTTVNHPYSSTDTFIKKIEKVCSRVYGVSDVVFPLEVQIKLRDWTAKYGAFPICISKTHKTFEPNAGETTVWVDDVELRAGAGFIVVKLGKVITLPGLPEFPSAEKIDVKDGKIIGLN